MMPHLILGLLWLHYFWCLVPSWRDGQYYEYGFLVPLIALGFAWRRAGLIEPSAVRPWSPGRSLSRLLAIMAGLALLFLIPLRMVEIGDPTWRPPLLLHGLLLTVASHLFLARSMGWKVSGFFLPVTIFMWSAVPYPWQVEQALVRQLTGSVVEMTQEVFLLQAVPVERFGERLFLGDEMVEVSEGCSGIRSLQSLVMAALFFGELLWLSWPRRVFLIGLAGLSALAVNTGRAYWLAKTQFTEGEAAAAAMHDMAGHVAFAASCLVLFAGAKILTMKRRKTLRVSLNKE